MLIPTRHHRNHIPQTHKGAVIATQMPRETPRASQASTRTPHKKEAMSREAKATSEKMHTCDKCGYTTLRADTMVHHVRTHTGERPFACPGCPYRSAQRSAMIPHSKVRGWYICDCNSVKLVSSDSVDPHLSTEVVVFFIDSCLWPLFGADFRTTHIPGT